MEREKALAKNTIIIGFGTFLPKVASIITLPIVTGSLTKAEYGTYDLLLTLISLVLPLATLQIQTAAFRFLVQIREKEEECSRVITNIVFFTMFNRTNNCDFFLDKQLCWLYKSINMLVFFI